MYTLDRMLPFFYLHILQSILSICDNKHYMRFLRPLIGLQKLFYGFCLRSRNNSFELSVLTLLCSEILGRTVNIRA